MLKIIESLHDACKLHKHSTLWIAYYGKFDEQYWELEKCVNGIINLHENSVNVDRPVIMRLWFENINIFK